MADENPAETPAEDGERITLSRAEYDRLSAASIAGERSRYQQEQAETDRQRTADERLAALEGRYRTAALRGALGDAVGSIEFLSDQARTDALALLAAEVEPRDIDDQIVVYHRATGRPLHEVGRDVIEARLSHLVRAQTQGGVSLPGPQPGGGGGAPSGSMAERLIEATRQAAAASGQRGPVGGFNRGF